MTERFTANRTIIDLREYYPKQFENNYLWRNTFGKLFIYLCKEYLTKANECWTVSSGLQQAYKDNYHIYYLLKPNYPDHIKLPRKKINQTNIKLVHHGVANPNRNIELMIKVVNKLPDNYSLDLYLVNNNPKYYKKLHSIIKHSKNSRLLAPVESNSLIETLSDYDIGLFCSLPRTFNLDHSWPNKVFEYIQAGLFVVATPLQGMKELKKMYPQIILTKSYDKKDIVESIRSLDFES